jgi:hypothetical protein
MLPKPRGHFPRVPLFRRDSLRAIPGAPGVYRIICVTWGRVYVGSTHDLPARFLEHKSQLAAQRHPNSWLQRAYDRCGPGAFVFQVLELYHGRWRPDCLSPAEQRWINDHPKLFNVRPAGSNRYLEVTRDFRGRVKKGPKRDPVDVYKIIGGPVSPKGKARSAVGGLPRRPGRATGSRDSAE